MRGLITLTEGRSGSNWLGSLSNKVGMLGISKEWFTSLELGPHAKKMTSDRMISYVLEQSSTENGFFAIKMFPAHVHWFNAKFQRDLLYYLVQEHDVLLIRLTRADRIRQAISFARGLQTTQWAAHGDRARQESYDFEMICRCYFLIDRSNQYWDSYLELRGLNAHQLVYEDMAISPKPYLDLVSDHAGVQTVEVPSSNFKVQRDQMTEEWMERFKADMVVKDIVQFSTPSRPHRKTFSNFLRFMRGEQMKPYPYAY